MENNKEMSTIDIVGVGDKKNGFLNTSEDAFEDMSQYLNIAKKCISSYAPKIRNGLAKEMLSNDDAVSNIAHAIMIADAQFNGTGDKYGFRKDRAIYAIKSYCMRSARANKYRCFSLDNPVNSTFSEPDITFSQTIADNSGDPEDITMRQEFGDKVLKLLDSISSKKAKKYIRRHYIDGVPVEDIAKENNVSRQGVYSLINTYLKKLRDIASSDDFFKDEQNES